MTGALLALLLTTFASPAEARTPLETIASCPNQVPVCLSLRIVVPEGLTLDEAWLQAQLAAAAKAFAVIDVAFEVASLHPSPKEGARVESRADRDALGRNLWEKGSIDVHVTGHLADVDVTGAAIRGVHWRDRADRSRRWVILSTIAGPHVLAHELGHFFGLPHTTEVGSLMNKSPAHAVPWSERGFAMAEQARMRRRLKAMRIDGTLRPVRREP